MTVEQIIGDLGKNAGTAKAVLRAAVRRMPAPAGLRVRDGASSTPSSPRPSTAGRGQARARAARRSLHAELSAGEEMSILVVGSVAFDTSRRLRARGARPRRAARRSSPSPRRSSRRCASSASSARTSARSSIATFRGRPIDLDGLERDGREDVPLAGQYSDDLNSRDTIGTELNVFADFKPKIPAGVPRLRRSCSSATSTPRCSSTSSSRSTARGSWPADTMNFWIERQAEELRKTLAKVDVLLINDDEARAALGRVTTWCKAAARHPRDGPAHVVVKQGEHGALLLRRRRRVRRAGVSARDVVDPTGAGDTFAGRLYLAGCPIADGAALRRDRHGGAPRRSASKRSASTGWCGAPKSTSARRSATSTAFEAI